MAQTKFGMQVEETAESLGYRVLPEVAGRVPRRSYKAGRRRLTFRVALRAGVAEGSYLAARDPNTTSQMARDL
ncbi:hypothetical protein [Streptomyces arboris]|uniref:hypothetical protein n=1 Tax=Streptomyces arboris TaxID=2600619 RepID=UPI003C2D8A31